MHYSHRLSIVEGLSGWVIDMRGGHARELISKTAEDGNVGKTISLKSK